MDDVPTITFAALVLVIGAITAWDDHRCSKIRNKWILTGLFCGALLHVIFILSFMLFHKDKSVRADYILKLLQNTVFAFVFGYLMWKIEIWSAGDSKLFLVFAFLLPLGFYSKGYIEYFPSFALAINIFAVSITAVLIRTIIGITEMILHGAFSFNWKAIDARARFVDARKTIAARWFMLVVMFTLFNLFFLGMKVMQPSIKSAEASVLINGAFIIFMFVAISPLSEKIEFAIKKYKWLKSLTILVIIVMLCFLLRDHQTAKKLAGNAKTIAGFMIFVGVTKKLLELYLKKTEVNKVMVDALCPGMVPTAETIKSISTTVDLSPVFMDGLSKEQIDEIKKACPGETELDIVRTIPFAPMAFGGLIMTIILQQSVIHLIKSLSK